jgi:hypothetical protein
MRAPASMTHCLIRPALGVVFAIAACNGTGDEPVRLTVYGTGFPDGDARVAVVKLPVLEIVACDTTAVVAGSFEVELGDILERGVGYRIDSFVDVDGDQHCEFGIDAVGSVELPPLDMATQPRLLEAGDNSAACASFETVCAAGFDR